MTNIFQEAMKQKQPSVKAENNEKFELEGVKTLSTIKSLISILEEEYTSVANELKDAASEEFIVRGVETKSRPKSFNLCEDDYEVNFQVRKSSSSLTENEINLLNKYHISTQEVEVKKESFSINSKYISDKKFLKKISDKLVEIPDLPSDFIVYSPPVKSVLLAESSIDDIFKNINDTDIIDKILNICSVKALKVNQISAEENLNKLEEAIHSILYK
jgi:hypothetical protein